MESVQHGKSSAPYGRACTHCVKAKSRCMLREGSGCERCHRLDKECVASVGIRKKSVKKSRNSKRAQLEDKLDDLMSILRTQSATPQQDSEGLQAVTPHSSDTIIQPARRGTMYGQSITEDLSAEQLNHEKPLLSLAIKTICNKAYSAQAQLSKKLRETIALKMMVNGEKSLDLLLSVLTFMTWSIYFTPGKQFLGMLAGIARSLVSDLELDDQQHNIWSPTVGTEEQGKAPRSNESRRAHVACFALSVMISTTLKHDMMQWSKQLEQDCSRLAIEEEALGDKLLVSIARIASICQQVVNIKRQLSDDNGMHGALHITPFLSSLDQLCHTFSDELSNHSSIIALKSTVRISIYELAIQDSTIQANTGSTVFDHRRAAHLMACLQLCKQFTEQYLTFDLITITTPTSFAFAYALRNLYKLSALRDAGWDAAIVRQTVDIVGSLDRCAAAAEAVNTKLKEKTGEDSVFSMAARSIRDLAPPNWRVPNTEPQIGGAAVTEGWTVTEGLDVSYDEFLDEFWLNSLFYP